MSYALRILSLLLLASCASNTPSAPSAREPAPVPAEGAPEIAERPFTAEQIRAATPVGRTYEFRLEVPDQPTTLVKIAFVETTPEGATTESSSFDAAGNPLGAPKRSTTRWDELVQHATYPRASTVISEEDVEVPAGKFRCLLYTVTEGELRTRAYFAKDLPGAPVLHVSEKNGKPVSTMTLLKHVAGG